MKNKLKPIEFGLLPLLFAVMAVFPLLGFSGSNGNNPTKSEKKQFLSKLENAPMMAPCSLSYTRALDNIGYCDGTIPVTSLIISILGNSGQYNHHMVVPSPAPKIVEKCDGTATITARFCGTNGNGNYVNNACWDAVINLSGRTTTNPGYMTGCAGNPDAGWYNYKYGSLIFNGVAGGLYNAAQIEIKSGNPNTTMQFGNGAAYHYEENNWQFGAGTWGDVIVNNPGTNNIRDNGAGDLQLSVGPKIADMVSWNYGCSSCRSVDQYGVGLQNTWNGNSYTLTIPNSSNVVSVILQAYFRDLSGHSNCFPQSVTLSTAAGSVVTPYYVIPGDINGQNPSSESASKGYRAQIDGATGTATLTVPTSCKPISFDVIVFRNDCTRGGTSGKSIDQFFYPGGPTPSACYNIPISTATGARDLKVRVPISDLSCGPTASVTVNISGVTSQSQTVTNCSPPLGADFQYVDFTFTNVPGSTNNVQVCTQAISGSYTINGVISVETECCTATVDAGANKSICQGTSTTISATGSGGTSPYSYSWSNGLGAGQSKTVSPANTTTYTVTVTDNTGCTNTDFVVITVNPIPGANAGADFTKTCQINLSGKQIGSAPVAGMAYSWLPNTGLSSSTIANPTANPSTTTTYTVTVTNSTTGCTATDQVIVTVNTNPPTANAGADFTKTCTSNPNGAPIGSTPVSGMSYIWAPTDGLSSSTIANPTANPTATTTYTLTVTNTSNGCTATDQVIVTVNTNPPTANAGSDFTKTCQINTSGKQIGSGPVAGMTYSWSPIAGLSNSAISNPIANPTSSTTYTVTVTNPNSGCTATDQVIVTVNINPPTANAGADFTKTCTQNIGGAQIGSAPVTGMTYAWLPTTGLSSASVSNPTANPSTTTTYTLTVTNTTNGCKATDQVVVTVNTNPPTANAGSNFTKTCTSNPSGAQIGSAPVTGMTYAWLPTTGLSSGTIANPTANPTATTTYTLTVTNTANGCTATDDVVVIVNTNPPTANAGSNFTKTCTSNPNGAQIGSAPVTGMTYAWLPTTGLSSGTIANPIANPTATTTYTLTVTNTANGCTATDQVVVSVNTNPPAANAGAAFTKTCTQNVNGAQIGTAPVAARSYLWSPTAGLSSSSISNPIANPLNTTTYTLTVTNTNNGCTATDQVVVTVNTTVPTANAGTDKTKCANSPAVQIGTAPVAGMSYIWSPTTGLSSGTIANPTANPTTTTTYTVTVTNTTNGCTATDQVIVTVNPLPVSGISAPGSVCATEGAFFQVNPPVAGATYSWTFDGGTPASSTASSVTVSWPISMIGTTRNVVLTVTSSNGCSAVYNHAINITQNPTANAGPDKEVCEGGSTAIGGSPSGPSGSSFLWTPNLYLNSNTVANPISTPPVSITYTLTTTINGCTKTDQVTVTVNTLLNPLVSATANPDPICAGKTSTLTAQGSANGGRGGPFQYIWNNGLGAGAIKTTPALNQNTTYVVTVVDAAQCTATNSVTVDVTPCGSIGDYVWIDTDGDGIQDGNESGLNGVTVLLKDQNGNVLSTKITTTGSSGLPGYYIFPDLMANSYIVMFMKPTGYQFTNDNSAGSTDTNDSDADLATGNTPVINLNPGQVVTNVDAGVYQPASIGNFVWEDTNGNGIQDPTEIGVNGVTVLLKDENGIVLKTTITATNGTSLGYYQFTGLEPGNYIVMFMSPSGYTLSDPNVPGSNDNNDSDANQSTGNTGIVNVTSGEIDQSVDAGIYRPATIGNFVWDDTNGNGIQDAGEPGINGVTVLLKDANGATLATTVTATNGATQGYYQFTNLEPGTYAVMFMTPTGYNPTESNAPGSVDTNDSDPNAQGTTPTVTVTSGGTNQTLDAGFYRPATIGNFVWDDTNGNGIQDAGEPGINGVTVLLKDANGATLATTVTATNGATQGYFQFTNLEPGTYAVMFMTPTGYNPTESNAPGSVDTNDSDPNAQGTTPTVAVTSGGTNQTLDAGFYRPATIGNFVWDDTNGNGIQDAGEPGINGVTVLLKDANGATLATTVTATNGATQGYYQFTNLEPGTYAVMFMTPTGYNPTESNAPGSVDTNDSDPNAQGTTPTVTVTSGGTNQTLDAGFYRPVTIGNFVWDDTNGNGIQDAGEPGINGVTVLLKDANGATLATTVTATNGATQGYYQFTNLEPGTYAVMFMTPTGYNPTESNAPGSVDTNDSDPNAQGTTPTVTVTSGGTNQTLDAGFYRPATIGNFVWDDTNGNGIQDAGEPGINGVTVLLKDANGATLATTVTATNGATQGYYQFTNLEPGTYAVMFMTPTGYNPTESNAPGSVDTNDSDPNAQGTTPTVTVTSGGTNQTLDAGFYRPATIGNFVWKDTNGNGIQDAGEPGINGVTVLLKDANGATLATTVTATNGATQGYYQFTNLEPGSYIVMFMTPTGYSGSPANSGNDDIDSDPNPLTGNTSVVTIISGQTNLSVDAGFVCNVIVSLPADFAICFGESAQINAAASNGIPQYVYNWSAGLGSGTPKTVSPVITTTYVVTVTDAVGCTASDALILTVNQRPLASAGADFTKTCTTNPNGAQIGGATVAGNTYSWSPAAGLSSTTVSNPTANPTATTTYTVTVTTTANGCTATDQVVVTVNTVAPIAAAGNDFTKTCTTNPNGAQIGGATVAGNTYSWSPAAGLSSTTVSNPTANPTATTTYTVTVTTTANGCTATDQVVVTVNTVAPAADAGADFTKTCTANSNGSQIGSATVAGNTYLWSPAAGLSSTTVSNPTANPTVTTTYTVTVTNAANGCKATDQVVVTVNTVAPIAAAGNDFTKTCTTNPNGAQIGSATVAGNTYSWSPAVGLSSTTVSNPTANPTVTTTYTVTVTNAANGCTATDQVVVTVNTVTPTADAGADFTKTCTANSNGSQIGGATVAGNTYSWSPAAGLSSTTVSNPTANPTVTTTYTVTVTTTANGCTATDQVVVTVNTVAPIAAAGNDFTKTCTTNPNGAQIGSATLAGNTYSWSPAAGLSSTTVSNPTANPTATTTYTVTVTTTANGCTATDQVVVTVNTVAPIAAAGNDFTKTCTTNPNGAQIGSATVAGNTYSWSPAAGLSSTTVSNPTANPTVTTTYTVTVTNAANGCTATDQVVVTVNTVTPTADAGADFTKTCTANSNGSQIGSATVAGNTYSWSPAAGLSSTTVSNPTANPTVTTTYTVTVTTTANGCTATDQVVVTVNTVAPIAAAGNDFTKTCTTNPNGAQIGSATVAGNSYSWSPAVGLSSTTVSNPTANPAVTTTYTVTVTNAANGCTATDQVVVTVNTVAPAADAGADFTKTCTTNPNGAQIGSATVAGNTYSWSPAVGLSSTTVSNPTANPAVTTTYTVTVTNAANGCTATDQVVVTVNTVAPAADAGADFTKTCTTNPNGAQIGSATVAGNTYSWSPAVGLSSTTVSNPTANPTVSTTYTVTVTNAANGCTATDQVVVTVNTTPPTADAGADFTKTCTTNPNGSQIGSAPVTGNTYSWSPVTGLSSSTIANPTANPTATTTYTVTVTTTANGCTATDQVVVTVNTTPPTADAGADFTKTCTTNPNGAQIGSAMVVGNTYSWSPTTGLSGSTIANPIANPTTTTTYTVTVTNIANGCTATDQVVVTVNTAIPSADAGTDFTKTCTTNPNGSQIGSAPVAGNSYSWSPAAGLSSSTVSNPTANPTATTTYTVTVTTTANGCTATDQVVVTVNTTPPTANAGADFTKTCTTNPNGSQIGSAPVTGNTYSWSPAAGLSNSLIANPTANPTATTTYTLTVTTTANGCTATDQVVVTVNTSVPNASATNDGPLTCNKTSVTLTATGGGSYLWWNGASTPTTNVSAPGTYQVTVTNTASGCTAVASTTVIEEAKITIGNFVWLDTNGNGCQEVNESGINGVTVKLYDSANNLIATTVTTNNTSGQAGYYEFITCKGSYYVNFSKPTSSYKYTETNNCGNDATDSDPNSSTGNTSVVVLNPGQTNNDLDAGFFLPAIIGDYVWVDKNANGIQESNETGLNGVTVILKDASGNVISTTVTANNPLNGNPGYYSFIVDPGTYVVQFVAPNGSVLTQPNAPGSNTSNDSDPNASGNSNPITVTSGQSVNTIDAGVYIPAKLGDYVWEDANKNGIQEPNENGVNGVTVLLKNVSGTTLQTTVTSNNPTNGSAGYYLFSNLTPGDYIVMVMKPNGFNFTTQNVVTGGTDSDVNTVSGNTAPVNLESGETDLTVDAGIYRTATLGNYVWYDLDKDGIQDPTEQGLNGFTVNLYTSTGTFVASTVTSTNPNTTLPGYYQFANLDPGTYYIQVIAPANQGYIPTVPNNNVTGTESTDSDLSGSNGPNTTTSVTLTSGQNYADLDAGYYLDNKIGDYVWEDTNRDGLQTTGEPGINGVTVNLFNSAGSLVKSTITANNPSNGTAGYYQFTDLTIGSYYVEFIQPTGYFVTTAIVGVNTTIDSDLNNANGAGTTSNISVIANTNNQTIDAGFIKGVKIGDFVWNDTGASNDKNDPGFKNGIQDPGENPEPNVTVRLKDAAGNTLQTTTTDNNGMYMFTVEPGKTYYLQFVAPFNRDFAPANVSSNSLDNVDSDVTNTFGTGTTDLFVVNTTDNFTFDAGIWDLALPLDLISFEGRNAVTHNQLTWVTANEVNVNRFSVERRKSSEKTFYEIGTVQAIHAASYGYDDYDVAEAGTYYYRLRMIDNDGSYEFSPIISIAVSVNKTLEMEIKPNPVNHYTVIHIEGLNAGDHTIEVFDLTGKILTKVVNSTSSKESEWDQTLDMSSFSAGTYYVRLISNDKSLTEKIMIAR